jgi:hypothetical protein
MRSRMLCVAALAALIAGGAPFASPAGAQTKPVDSDPTAKPPRPKAPKARVTVQQRSFLDAGTEVLPGQRKFTDYAFPPGYSPTGVIDYTSANVTGPHGGLPNPYGFGRPFGW